VKLLFAFQSVVQSLDVSGLRFEPWVSGCTRTLSLYNTSDRRIQGRLLFLGVTFVLFACLHFENLRHRHDVRNATEGTRCGGKECTVTRQPHAPLP